MTEQEYQQLKDLLDKACRCLGRNNEWDRAVNLDSAVAEISDEETKRILTKE